MPTGMAEPSSWEVDGVRHAKLRAHPHQWGPGKTHALYRTYEKPHEWLVYCTGKVEETIHGERVPRETEIDCKRCLKQLSNGGRDW